MRGRFGWLLVALLVALMLSCAKMDHNPGPLKLVAPDTTAAPDSCFHHHHHGRR